jgi:hypothetical protein
MASAVDPGVRAGQTAPIAELSCSRPVISPSVDEGKTGGMPQRRRIAGCLITMAGLLAVAAPSAHAGIFGTDPLAISLNPGAGAPNGPSAHPALSGDNRKTRLAAFDSTATNLVAGDTNGQPDVFVWSRPGGSAGLVLNRPGGSLKRVSVSSSGGQADGASTNPSVDGSTRNSPHCVAFQSTATNLAAGDGDATSDIFVRDLRANRTTLVSRGIAQPAQNPSIDGLCKRVSFSAGGIVYTASAHGGRPKPVGRGDEADYSLDGTAIVWVNHGRVFIDRKGRTSEVGPGDNPTVGDNDSGKWAISFDTTAKLSGNDHNPGRDVYQRLVHEHGRPYDTDLISASRRGGNSLGGNSYNGGLTAYAGTRGIVVFVNDQASSSDLYYRNNHSGNIDDLAHAPASAPITDVVSSARANFVAFDSAASFVGDTGGQQAVFFKHLIDGEAI